VSVTMTPPDTPAALLICIPSLLLVGDAILAPPVTFRQSCVACRVSPVGCRTGPAALELAPPRSNSTPGQDRGYGQYPGGRSHKYPADPAHMTRTRNVITSAARIRARSRLVRYMINPLMNRKHYVRSYVYPPGWQACPAMRARPDHTAATFHGYGHTVTVDRADNRPPVGTGAPPDFLQ